MQSVSELKLRLGPRDRAADRVSRQRPRDRAADPAGREARNETGVDAPPTPVGVPENWEEHVKLMFELMALAYQGNITRVMSFMLARELSTLSYPQIGVADGHHPVSHNNNIPEQMAKKAKIDMYHLDLFGQFLDRLQGDAGRRRQPARSFAVPLRQRHEQRQPHTHDNLPTLLVGGAAGRLKGNRHIKMAKSTPLSNLMIALLDKAGVETDRFGESSGRIEV